MGTEIAQPLVVSFGGGVNSAAMLIGLHDRGLCPDLILFADTGGEKPATYDFIRNFNAWLARHHFPEITKVSVADNQAAVDKTLEGNCLRLRFLPSIVYGFKKCSQRWKVDPQRRYLNSWQPALKAWENGKRVVTAIGYDAGETHRGRGPDDKQEYIFPLREWGWGREACLCAIELAGIAPPPKSACFFCPSSTKREVLSLKSSHPDLFERALAIERNAAQYAHTVRGLGRHWSWEQVAAADEAQFKMFPETVQVPCMCFDGEGEEEPAA